MKCPMLPTKRAEWKKSHESLKLLAEFAMYARRRRDSGYPLSFNEMSVVEFECLLKADMYVEHEEITHRQTIAQMLMAGFRLEKQ